MEYVTIEELEDLFDIDDVAELAHRLAPSKGRKGLADNAALPAHAVFERRAKQKEVASSNAQSNDSQP